MKGIHEIQQGHPQTKVVEEGKMSVPVEFKNDIRKFAESTSIRGVSRALKSADFGSRVIWTTTILVGTSILIWQLQLVVTRYLRYESATLLRQISTPPVREGVCFFNNKKQKKTMNRSIKLQMKQLVTRCCQRLSFDVRSIAKR